MTTKQMPRGLRTRGHYPASKYNGTVGRNNAQLIRERIAGYRAAEEFTNDELRAMTMEDRLRQITFIQSTAVQLKRRITTSPGISRRWNLLREALGRTG